MGDFYLTPAKHLYHGLSCLGDNADEIVAQYLLLPYNSQAARTLESNLIGYGDMVCRYLGKTNAEVVERAAYVVEIDGMKLCCLNSPTAHSLSFLNFEMARTCSACLVWNCTAPGRIDVSLYGLPHTPVGTSLLPVALRYGGGGHALACGCTIDLEQARVLGII